MSRLMYNPAQDVITNRAQLAQLETPAARGRFHQPYPFDSYVDEVEFALNQNGIEVVSEEYAVTKDDNRMFGMMEIAPKEGQLITADDWKLNLALRGSHDERIPRGIALGTSVMICSNLCFSGNLGTFKTKQTLNIAQRLPAMINEAVSRIPELAESQERKFEAYKNYNLRSRIGDAALVEMHRQGGLTSAQLGKAIAEWDKPTYDEHGELGDTVWKLFNASTEALKPTGDRVNMNTILERSIIVSNFMDRLVGV